MGGAGPDALKEFIEDIPEEKLCGFLLPENIVYTDKNFRPDMQGVGHSLFQAYGTN